MKNYLLLSVTLVFLAACSSPPPVKLTADDITLKREAPGEDCKSLGRVEGRVSTIKGNMDEALADLKQQAISKGATYVHVGASGAMGQSVRGEAFFCP